MNYNSGNIEPNVLSELNISADCLTATFDCVSLLLIDDATVVLCLQCIYEVVGLILPYN